MLEEFKDCLLKLNLDKDKINILLADLSNVLKDKVFNLNELSTYLLRASLGINKISTYTELSKELNIKEEYLKSIVKSSLYKLIRVLSKKEKKYITIFDIDESKIDLKNKSIEILVISDELYYKLVGDGFVTVNDIVSCNKSYFKRYGSEYKELFSHVYSYNLKFIDDIDINKSFILNMDIDTLGLSDYVIAKLKNNGICTVRDLILDKENRENEEVKYCLNKLNLKL